MKIAIVEDEQATAREVKQLLYKYQQTDVTCYISGEQFLFEYESHPVDLILMDIQMAQLSGLETAKALRKMDKNVSIVFLTNDPSYVFEGYEVDAIRYWLKPIQEDKLAQLLTSLQQMKPYLLWKMDKDVLKLYEEDIYYLESDGHYVLCHHKEGVYRMKATLSHVCEQVSKEFILCHRSYCVNLNHVHALLKDGCRMDNQEMLPVSRAMKVNLQEAFMEKCKENLVCNF